MALMRFDPLREMEDLSTKLNQWFGPMARRPAGENGMSFADWTPAMDVEETDKEYLLKADLPEMKKEDLKIGIEDDVLTLQGERKHEEEEKGKKFHRIERSYGKFMRQLELPSDVDQRKVKADVKDGVVLVHLPKSATAKPKSFTVQIT